MSRTRPPNLRLAALCAMFCLSTAARATVDPPLLIRWGGGPVPTAIAGQELSGSLELEAGAAGELSDLELTGDGWITTLDSPPAMMLREGEVRRFAFRATPRDPATALEFRALFEGAPVSRQFRLDAATLKAAGAPRALRYLDPAGPRLTAAGPGKSQTIHFQGRVAYTRSDNAVLGADGVRVTIWDEDTFDSEQMWSGSTDPNGYFDVSVSWNDCDVLGCDDPDIYLMVDTSGSATTLRDDTIVAGTYGWSTGVTDDFTGSAINYGVMLPLDPATDGAMQVYTSLVRAARLAALDGGMTAPTVASRWPDTFNRTYYNGFEIHIGQDQTWVESTIHHEYGHHLSQSFATLTPTNYSNGFCDTPSPGHCVWCPENVTDAWQEGWADWFGGYVTRQYQTLYGVAPLSINDNRYVLETPLSCGQDGQTYPNALTEGFVGALLRDIEDASNDDHDGGGVDCDIDALSLGDDEIFTVFRDDDPTTEAQFMTAFRGRYPQFDSAMWSTARNVATAFGYATPMPAVTSQNEACANYRYGDAMTLTVTGNGPNLQYQWLRDGVAIPGVAATSPSYLLILLNPGMAGDYSCRVTSCDGTLSVTSVPVQLRVFGGSGADLVSWGENSGAQAGIGNNIAIATPHTPGVTNLIAADGGRLGITGIRSNGDVYTWGTQNYGELGNGFTPPAVSTPTRINGVSNAVAVAAGSYHVLVVTADGAVRSYGYNGTGALGDLTYNNRSTPVPVQIPGCVVDVAAGWYFSLFLTGDGQVYACGDNDKGQLGYGVVGSRSATPAPIAGLDDCIAIAAGGQTGYALKSDGSVFAWGQNNLGQLGNGGSANSLVPVHVGSTGSMRTISAGITNAYAVGNDGVVWGWGDNGNGQMGDPAVVGVTLRTPITFQGVVQPVALEATENYTTLAVMADGRLLAWGRNNYSCFGTPTPNSSYVPLPVPGLSGVKGVATGYGTVFAYGHLGSASDVAEPPATALPTTLSLRSSPNPFVGRLSLALDLPESGRATVRVYDVAGRLVRTVLDETRRAGPVAIDWDGRDDTGGRTPAGIYLVRMQVGDRVVSGKVLRLE
jgi:alpha-tubulin suppressor-like RCC1 family protein